MRALFLRKKLLSEESPSDPKALYAKTRERAIGFGEELLTFLSCDLKQGQGENLAAIWALLPFYVDVVATADGAIAKSAVSPQPSEAARPQTLSYVVSSMFLAFCFSYLTSQPKHYERLHLVTGKKLSAQCRSLDLMSKVALSEQSEVGAVADQAALSEALADMGRWGHALHAMFHSHPGHGALATLPSSTDLETHERYERGGVPLVGCIFARDGTLRFFRYSPDPFSITIYGTGIVPINEDEHVYKLQNPTSPPRFVSFDTSATEAEG
jgi:hypothetical protein